MEVFKVFLIVFCWVLVSGLPTSAPDEKFQSKIIEALLQKEKETEALPPVVLSKDVTFIHKYNDTTANEETQHASSKIKSFGGLENKIQNIGGVQRTILNNKIQYNFYFWLVPKNFRKDVDKPGKF